MLQYLVKVAGICAVAGSAFYAPGSPAAGSDWHVRFSFCNDTAELQRGLQKLANAEQKLAR
jgi:aspartate/methionine/tyrosine aminotransferase